MKLSLKKKVVAGIFFAALAISVFAQEGEFEPVDLPDKGTIHELLQNIEREYPALGKRIEQGIAIAIDGNIYRDDWEQPIPEDAEVVLLTRIAGG